MPSLASLANAAPAFEVLIIFGELLDGVVKYDLASLAIFILKDGAFEAIQANGFVDIEGFNVARQLITTGGDANSYEGAAPMPADSDELDQVNANSVRTLTRAWLDQAFVDGDGVGCSKDKGDDGEDSGEVHLVSMRSRNLML